MSCEVVPLGVDFYHGNGQNAKKIVERDKPIKSESVGQTLPQLPWKQKRGHLNIF
jgi:hypothetical protein